MTDRAVSPIVGKAMEATIVVLYLGLVTSVLYGGVVPEYRATAGDEVAERTVAGAAVDLEDAIPPATIQADVRVQVSLPATIAGDTYRVRATSDRLVLEHPDPDVAAEAALVLPGRVTVVDGTWESGSENEVHVTAEGNSLEVHLE